MSVNASASTSVKKKKNTSRNFSSMSNPSSTMYDTKRTFRQSLDTIKNASVKSKIQKALVTNSDFAKNYGYKTSEDIREFEKVQNSIKGEYLEIHDDNQHFSKYYQRIEDMREVADEKKLDKVTRIEATFSDLINKYRERGYKIPDLSVKNNLFEPSPLLLENPKINDFFKFLPLHKINESKDQVFLDKLHALITEKQMQYENPEDDKTPQYNRRASIGFFKRISLFKDLVFSEPDLDVENKNLKKENAKRRALTNQYAFKVNKMERILTMNSKSGATSKKISTNLVPPLNINGLSKTEPNPMSNLNGVKKSSLNIETDLMFSPSNAYQNRSNKSRNVDFIIRRSMIKLDDKTSFKTRTVDKMSNLETAGNTDRSKMKKIIYQSSEKKVSHAKITAFHNKTLSSNSIKSNSFLRDYTDRKKLSKKNVDLRFLPQKLPLVDMSHTSRDFITLYNSNSHREDYMNDLQSEKVIRELYENKRKFLDYCLEKMEIEKMSVNDLKDLAIDYCVSFLGHKEELAEETIGKKVDPMVLWTAITDLKSKVDSLDVKEKIINMYNFGESARKGQLDIIKELDKEVRNLKYVLVKKVNIGQQ